MRILAAILTVIALSGCTDTESVLAQCRLDHKGKERDCMSSKGYDFTTSESCWTYDLSAYQPACYSHRNFAVRVSDKVLSAFNR